MAPRRALRENALQVFAAPENRVRAAFARIVDCEGYESVCGSKRRYCRMSLVGLVSKKKRRVLRLKGSTPLLRTMGHQRHWSFCESRRRAGNTNQRPTGSTYFAADDISEMIRLSIACRPVGATPLHQ